MNMGSISRMGSTSRALDNEKVKELMEKIESFYQSEQLTGLYWDQCLELQFVLLANLKLPELDRTIEIQLTHVHWDPEWNDVDDLIFELKRRVLNWDPNYLFPSDEDEED
jgi:hypothetical protein